MKIRIPVRGNIKETSAADPLKFYYFPVARSFYLARFADSIRLLGNRVNYLVDAGCGSGIFLPELAKHCDKLLACDLHPNLYRINKMLKMESVKATLIRSDICCLPYATGSIDAIVSMSVLEHLHDLEPAVETFYRILKPGGVAIIGVPVTNIITEAILRMSYLSLDAKLEDEHVSTHQDVLNSFGQKFVAEDVLNIPRFLPRSLCLYSTVRFRKPEQL